MKVTIRRSGGFAGTSETLADVDTARLAAAAAHRVADAVRAARFFELPADVPGDIGGDMFRYEIAVTEGGRTHTVATTGEPRPGSPLRSILDAVV